MNVVDFRTRREPPSSMFDERGREFVVVLQVNYVRRPLMECGHLGRRIQNA